MSYLKDAPLATLIHVGFERWPAQPYLSIDANERHRRLALLYPDFFPSADPYLAKTISPYMIPAGFELKVHEGITYVECSLVAQTDYEFELREGLKELETLSSSNPRYLVAVLIDPADGRTQYLKACKAIWNIVVPKHPKFPKHKRGLGSLFAQSPSALRKLSAWKLHRVYGMSVEEVIAFWGEKVNEGRLKKAYYGDSKNCLRAIQECEIALKKYLR